MTAKEKGSIAMAKAERREQRSHASGATKLKFSDAGQKLLELKRENETSWTRRRTNDAWRVVATGQDMPRRTKEGKRSRRTMEK